MIRIAILLILTALGLSGPARACSTSGSSTFCADGWVAQAVEPRRPDSAPDAEHGNTGSMDPGLAPDGVYVEGAVVLDDPPPEVDGEL